MTATLQDAMNLMLDGAVALVRVEASGIRIDEDYLRAKMLYKWREEMLKNEWDLLTDEDFREIARELFKKIDVVRAFSSDYEAAVKILRDVYDRGRSRGAYEYE